MGPSELTLLGIVVGMGACLFAGFVTAVVAVSLFLRPRRLKASEKQGIPDAPKPGQAVRASLTRMEQERDRK